MPHVDAEETACERCGAPVAVPAEVRERARELTDAGADRRRAKALLGELPRPLPLWLARALPAGLFVVLPVWIVVAVTGWVAWGWFETPLHMLGWGIFTPAFLYIFLLIDALAARANAYGQHSLSPIPLADGHGCRACGASLSFAESEVVVRCRYCGADSLWRDHSSAWEARLSAARERAQLNLVEALLALRAARADRFRTRLIVLGVLVPFWLLFCGPLVWALLFGPSLPPPTLTAACSQPELELRETADQPEVFVLQVLGPEEPVAVTVDRPGSEVVLVLSSPFSASWEVNVGADTEVVEVVTLGALDHRVVGVEGVSVREQIACAGEVVCPKEEVLRGVEAMVGYAVTGFAYCGETEGFEIR